MDQVFEREVRSSQPPGYLLKFQKLSSAHLPEIIEIAKESFDVLWAPSEFLYFIESKSGVCQGLFFEDKMICYCLGLDIQGDLDIVSIATASKFRRQGLAAILLKNILENISGEAFLEVDVRNTAARAFYKKMGFNEGRMRKSYYQGKYDAICMALPSQSLRGTK